MKDGKLLLTASPVGLAGNEHPGVSITPRAARPFHGHHHPRHAARKRSRCRTGVVPKREEPLFPRRPTSRRWQLRDRCRTREQRRPRHHPPRPRTGRFPAVAALECQYQRARSRMVGRWRRMGEIHHPRRHQARHRGSGEPLALADSDYDSILGAVMEMARQPSPEERTALFT